MYQNQMFENMQYLIRYPKSYKVGEKYPVILFFHGAGSRGTDLNLLKGNDFFTITDQEGDFPFVTIAPQCHEDTWFDLWETVKRFVEEITSFEFCDPTRVYAVGHSMGGYATWQIGMSLRPYFAAIVPICGGGMYWNAERLKTLRIWAFHGEEDCVVKCEESKNMVDAVNASGGKAKLTIYPGCGHESWRKVYSDSRIFEWLLEGSSKDSGETMDEGQDEEECVREEILRFLDAEGAGEKLKVLRDIRMAMDEELITTIELSLDLLPDDRESMERRIDLVERTLEQRVRFEGGRIR